MIRYFRIFLLYLENVFQYRSQIFVWFLISLFHPIIYLLFWNGLKANNTPIPFADITTYYLLFIVAGGFLFVHVEADAYEDIQNGNLSSYLTKPFPYIIFKFMSELPWRIIQGSFGLITLFVVSLILPGVMHLSQPLSHIFFVALLIILGYITMFLTKMNVLLSALWFIDIGALTQIIDLLIVILAGFIMPLRLFPAWASTIAFHTPFPYAVYYPIIAVQGDLSIPGMLHIISIQLMWIGLLTIAYVLLWHKGRIKFQSVGQ